MGANKNVEICFNGFCQLLFYHFYTLGASERQPNDTHTHTQEMHNINCKCTHILVVNASPTTIAID